MFKETAVFQQPVREMNFRLLMAAIPCCGREPLLRTRLAAISWGSPTVAMKLYPQIPSVTTRNGEAYVIDYAWWNCEDAQMEAGSNNVPIAGGYQAPWHDYGWYWGWQTGDGQTKTETVTGSTYGWGDPGHWQWSGGILYMYCDSRLHIFQVKLVVAKPEIEFEWSSHMGFGGGWVNPHDN